MVINLSINKHSLFLHITLFFIAMIITSHIIIYKGYSIKKQEQIDIHTHRYFRVLYRAHKDIIKEKLIENPELLKRPKPPKYIDNEININVKNKPPRPPFEQIKITKEELNKELEKYDMEIPDIHISIIKSAGEVLAQDEDWQLYEYEGFHYFYFNDKFRNVLVKDNIQQGDKTISMLILTALLNIVFISFYLFLIKKLIPLRSLKNNIKLFSKGNLDIDTSVKGKDEISEVANEFNNAINQIRTLTESRNLFLRNIMHEFKTPIARGFIIADMLEDNKYHENLKKAFQRLEYLLSELARLEILTSNNVKLKKEEFRVVDILDNSLDILLLDCDSIDLNITTQENIFINVDFEFFSVAIKNLIDNALKYGNSKPKVIISNNSISVSNEGKELEKPLNEYFKAFNRNYESSSKSLGLGLYIVHSILKAHSFKLTYTYENNCNIFTINF